MLASIQGFYSPRRHAELVSAPHMLSVHHAGHLSYGILKQVQEDFGVSKCNGALFVALTTIQSKAPCDSFPGEGR